MEEWLVNNELEEMEKGTGMQFDKTFQSLLLGTEKVYKNLWQNSVFWIWDFKMVPTK
jgi:hypothetical protein